MRGLKVCLWMAAVGCLLSVVGLFMSPELIESLFNWFRVDEQFPDGALVMYMFRLMSGTSVIIGVFFAILAIDPSMYGVLLPFSGLAAVAVGMLCAVTGIALGVVPQWYLGDALPCVIIGVLIFAFWQKTKQEKTS